MDLKLLGKRAVVTGGSRGIGKAIARTLAEEGVTVVIAARGKEALDATVEELTNETGSTVTGVVVDTGSDDSVANLIYEANEILGGIDILVNCAARPGGQGVVPTLVTSPRSKLLSARIYSRSAAIFAGRRPTPHAALSPVAIPTNIFLLS